MPRPQKISTATLKEKNDTRRAGGLVKTLKLAINGRVMLTRNLNPRLGLVNGSTGVLTKILCTDNKPTALIIKFDRIDETQLINKVSAVFTIGLDEQCTRTQFPVKMCFAATIHKCQGLTLKNVVIQMANSFSAGQIFVACSRVKNIDGLHLADYVPDKVRVDIPSLKVNFFNCIFYNVKFFSNIMCTDSQLDYLNMQFRQRKQEKNKNNMIYRHQQQLPKNVKIKVIF